MSNAWPMVALGEVIRQRKEFVRVDDTREYKRCRVQLHAQGIVLRDIVAGAEIKTKDQQVCHASEFLVAEIDAKVGGFGIVPADLEGAIVSSHYFLFEVNESALDRKFLSFYIRTAAFRDQVSAQGSTNYAAIRPSDVLGYLIPLPPLDVQRRIVVRIEELAAKIEQARGLRLEAQREANAITDAETTKAFEALTGVDEVLLGRLGVDEVNPIQTGPFGAQLHTSDFVSEGIPVLNVGNVRPEGLDRDQLDFVSPEKAASLTRYVIQVDDLLFARTGATLGKVCLVPPGCDGWLMTGHLFRVRLDQSRCDPRFAFVALRGAKSIRAQIFDQVRGATRPGFNTTLLSRVRLPLPSLSEQRRIVAYLDSVQAKMGAVKRLQAETAAELDALLPAVLDRAFKGEL